MTPKAVPAAPATANALTAGSTTSTSLLDAVLPWLSYIGVGVAIVMVGSYLFFVRNRRQGL